MSSAQRAIIRQTAELYFSHNMRYKIEYVKFKPLSGKHKGNTYSLNANFWNISAHLF